MGARKAKANYRRMVLRLPDLDHSKSAVAAGTSLLTLAPEASGVARGLKIPVVTNRKTIPADAALVAKNIPSLQWFGLTSNTVTVIKSAVAVTLAA